MYKKIDNNDILFFKKELTETQVVLKDDMSEDIVHDEMKMISSYPEILVYALSVDDVKIVMEYASQKQIPVTVRGAGTGLVGGCVPIYGGILLDLSRMNNILELDEKNLTLTVEPGVLLMELASYVEERGYFYAPDPGEKSATIGGNIATNAGGMRAVKYGVTRDWVRSLDVVLPSGELITLSGKVVKDSSGFSLKDLIIGSEGTLGIIVKAVLKLIPKPRKSVSLLVPFNDIDKALSAANVIVSYKVIPTAIEYLNKTTLAFSKEFLGKEIPHANYPAYLLLSFDGNSDVDIDNTIDDISALAIDELGAVDVYLVDTDERKESVWQARGAFLEAIKASTTEMDECDVVLPRDKINEFIFFTEKLSEKLNIRIPYFGHVGDGNLHIYLCRDNLQQKQWERVLEEGFKALYDNAFSLGGKVSGEHGIGYAKKMFLEKQVGKIQITLMKGIKKLFDPNNILNPGKVINT